MDKATSDMIQIYIISQFVIATSMLFIMGFIVSRFITCIEALTDRLATLTLELAKEFYADEEEIFSYGISPTDEPED